MRMILRIFLRKRLRRICKGGDRWTRNGWRSRGRSALGQTVASLPDFVFIINAGNRRTPVCDYNVGLVTKNTVFSDINLFPAFGLIIQIIDPAKIRILIRGAVFLQLSRRMILQTLARHHLIVELHVAALHHAKQFLCLFVTLLKFRLIPGSIFQYQFPAIVKIRRAPISSVYYENEIGEGCYRLPESGSGGDEEGEEIPICLYLKRTYDVEKGVLKGYYDSDVAANDALLVQYLSQNKDAVLGDIIATIQKEQNEIIRESPFKNILVQGVAGSGKTTVAMHRISYILYNYKERFTSNEFCIIGGNDLLLSYITSGLPELDVHDVKQKRMDAMITYLLKKEWTKKQKLIAPLPDAELRSRMEFILTLERWLLRLRRQKVTAKELRDRELGVILTESSIERLREETPEYSIYRLLVTLDERVRTKLKFLSPDGEKEYYQKKCREYKQHYKNQAVTQSVCALYQEFLTDYAEKFPGTIDLLLHEQKSVAGEYDVYDAIVFR